VLGLYYCYTPSPTEAEFEVLTAGFLWRGPVVDAGLPEDDQPGAYYEDDLHHPVKQDHQKGLFLWQSK
jgi:hypothetical protein